MESKSVLTRRDVADQLGVAPATVDRLIKQGEIKSIRISPRRIIIPAKAFEEWLNDRANRA